MIINLQMQHYMVVQFLLSLLLVWLLGISQAGAASASGGNNERNTGAPGNAGNTTAVQKPAVSFNQVNTFPGKLKAGDLSMQDIPSPHWKSDGCIACHTTTGDEASAKNLRRKPVEKTCYNCHSAEFDHSYIHPTNVRPDKKMLARMDRDLKASLLKHGNTIGCTTCHDLTLQCKTDRKKQKLTNPKFFRHGPYESRTQLCFFCHDKDQYQRFNPHEQIDEKGQLRAEKCRICHLDSLSRLRHVEDIEQMKFIADESLSTLCWGCHPWTPHPGGQFSFFKQKSGPDHLVKPSASVIERMDEMTKKNNINLPLEPNTGKLFCGTCHSTHEKGVISNPAAAGTDEPHRMRAKNICEYCHDI